MLIVTEPLWIKRWIWRIYYEIIYCTSYFL